MKNYPDNIVYDYKNNLYDAFKKEFPTNIGSPQFDIESTTKETLQAADYFKQKKKELRKEYIKLFSKIKWNQLIYTAKYRFKPVIGKIYHLYEIKGRNYLSIIHPYEWKHKHLGSFKLLTNYTWEKID